MSAGDDTARRLGLGLGDGAAGWTPPAVEALAGVFPGLKVLALAGRGGMGAVYRAEQTRLGRMVAIKLQPAAATADPLARERFEREARLLAELRHANVVQIFDFGALADGTPYLVTEWAEGGDLATRLEAGPAGLAEAAGWVAQIAGALDAAHARGVVHRDLKPANVLVRGDGSLALADFGLARARGAGFTTELTLSWVVFGTLDYMAPEQMAGAGAAGEITPATDVYALGVMTYRMLTGRVPRGVFVKASRFTAGVPAAVDAVIEAALAHEAGRRPKSAGEFARRFAAAASGARRRMVLGGAGVVAALVLAGLAAVWVGTERGVEEELGAAMEAPVLVISEPSVPSEWTDLLAGVRPEATAIRGGWTRRGDGVASDAEVAVLGLPGAVEAGFRYDVEVEFTRLAGRHSVGVILPTRAGTGIFELDAWERGLGGLQMIDGRDMREHGQHFPAALRNGERQRVRMEVRGARVTAIWNGVTRRTWELSGRRLSVPDLWAAGGRGGLGLASWLSPTVFHRVEYRAAAAE
jgi:aminoglycoside phosphotransferase (APT) family kinase protein